MLILLPLKGSWQQLRHRRNSQRQSHGQSGAAKKQMQSRRHRMPRSCFQRIVLRSERRFSSCSRHEQRQSRRHRMPRQRFQCTSPLELARSRGIFNCIECSDRVFKGLSRSCGGVPTLDCIDAAFDLLSLIRAIHHHVRRDQ